MVKKSVAVKSVWAGLNVHECSIKPTRMFEKANNRRLFSFVPPTSGMFIWVSGSFKSGDSLLKC